MSGAWYGDGGGGPAAADRRAAGGPCGRQDGGRAWRAGCRAGRGRGRCRPPNEAGGGAGRRARAGLPTPNEGAAMRSDARPGDGRGRGGARTPAAEARASGMPEQRRDKGGFGGKKTFPTKDQTRNVAYSRPPRFSVGRHDAGRKPGRMPLHGRSEATTACFLVQAVRHPAGRCATNRRRPPRLCRPQVLPNELGMMMIRGPDTMGLEDPRATVSSSPRSCSSSSASRRTGRRAVGVVAVGSDEAVAVGQVRTCWPSPAMLRALLSMPRR